ncbi:DUF305 domain-containing protein [Psychrobacter frigidicola]|uniref:CopM family metallochaperone n=1 Tax=Psychrobacter frigidicola TaxID=45611 RepID=UPI00191A68CA|nr:DUF305 domain-containing protein [Psychrobacter frigidicola]
MTASYRFALLTASVAAALALSACQPTPEDNTEATPTEDVIPTPIEAPEGDTDADMEAHADNDMADEGVMSDMLKDYTKSMTKMHDEMMIGMNYNDPDTAFAKSMLGHHRGAIDMAKSELKYGSDAAMLKLAQEIIDSQQLEIDTMKKWLASHLDSANPKPETPAMQQAFAEGIDAMYSKMMVGIADPVPDMAFARGMLPHHVGAVDMAMVQLKYGKDEEMRKLAQEIIDAQQPEIELMQDWIAMNGTDETSINGTGTDAQKGLQAPIAPVNEDKPAA